MKYKFKPPFLPLLIAGIAVILFSSAGIAHWAMAAWSNSGDDAVLAGLPEIKVRCAGCGVIVSLRKIEIHNKINDMDSYSEVMAGNRNKAQDKSAGRRELTIRLADGSTRVINETSPARWRLGEHVIVIDGEYASNP